MHWLLIIFFETGQVGVAHHTFATQEECLQAAEEGLKAPESPVAIKAIGSTCVQGFYRMEVR